jgi:flagellar export protein FliJ
MKPFRFSLQALLTLRRRAEQVALEKYASALLVRRQALEQCDQLHQEQSQWWARWRHELDRGCSGSTIELWHSSNEQLAERQRAAESALAQAELGMNQALQGVLLSRRDREAVEKHLQRQRAHYLREVGRDEQKQLDDLAHRHVLPLLPASEPNRILV